MPMIINLNHRLFKLARKVVARSSERRRAHGIAAHGSMSASESPAEKCSAGHDMSLRPKKRAAKDEEDSKEDVQGRKAAKGSCHCCGGMLKRNPDFAKVCGTCGARFHTYDCGNRRGDVGFRDFSKCLRVSHISARIRRGSRPGTGAPHQPHRSKDAAEERAVFIG